MLTRSFGWFAILLMLIGIVRSVPMSPDRSVKASPPPAVVTIDPEATAEAEIESSQPDDGLVKLEERIEVLEAKASAHKELINSILTTQTETVQTIARIVEVQEKLQRALLGQLKQSVDEKPAEPTAPPKPAQPNTTGLAKLVMHFARNCQASWEWKAEHIVSILHDGIDYSEAIDDSGKPTPWMEATYRDGRKVIYDKTASYQTIKNAGIYSSNKPETAPRIEPQAKLFAFGAEWCQPCKAWKAGPDAEKIAADGCEIVPVDIDKIEPGKPKPASVPYFELWIGTNFARHSGPLTFEKYKAMEKAVRETSNRPLKSASPSIQKKWRVDEGHVTPSVEGMTIEHHLTEHHGVNVDGMTVAEMEAKHQSIDHSKLNQSKSAYQRSPIASARFKDLPRALGWMRVGK